METRQGAKSMAIAGARVPVMAKRLFRATHLVPTSSARTVKSAGLNELIGELYQNVGDSEALSRTIMGIVWLTRSWEAQYGVFDQNEQAWSVGIDMSMIQSYLAKYARADHRSAWLSHPAQVAPRQQTVADQEAYQRSVPVNEFQNKVDSRLAIAALTPVDPEVSVGFGIMRSRPYGEEKIKAMTPLLHHIVRAITLHIKLRRLESACKLLEAMVDKLATPAMLLDRAGRLRYANAAGHEALARGTYIALARHGRITARTPRQQAELDRAIATALAESGVRSGRPDSHVSGSLRLQGADGHAALLIIHALAGQLDLIGMPQAHVALFLTSHETMAPDPIRFARIFDLTAAETRLVEHLLNGESLNEIAERVRVGRETLRSQLRSLFAKTDTRRQAELISRLLGSLSVALV